MKKTDNTAAATTAEEYRNKADELRRRSRESWERSDTDGCVTQWCSDWGAREAEARAALVDAGEVSTFVGLYEGDRRVAAKLVRGRYPEWNPKQVWCLREDERERFDRNFVPLGGGSRVQKALGLTERTELAPAWVKLDGRGRGLGSLTTLHLRYYRTGDEWGLDAELVADEEVGE